jgi:hypothetical protein
LQKFREKTDHSWVFNFPSCSRASRSGFYSAAAAVKKIATKPQSQPPGKNSTAETSSILHLLTERTKEQKFSLKFCPLFSSKFQSYPGKVAVFNLKACKLQNPC